MPPPTSSSPLRQTEDAAPPAEQSPGAAPTETVVSDAALESSSTHSVPKTPHYLANPDGSVKNAGDIASQPPASLALVSRLVTKRASKVSSANDLTACSSDDNPNSAL